MRGISLASSRVASPRVGSFQPMAFLAFLSFLAFLAFLLACSPNFRLLFRSALQRCLKCSRLVAKLFSACESLFGLLFFFFPVTFPVTFFSLTVVTQMGLIALFLLLSSCFVWTGKLSL